MKKKPVKSKLVQDTLQWETVTIKTIDDLKRMFMEAIEMEENARRTKKKVAAMKAKPKKKTKK